MFHFQKPSDLVGEAEIFLGASHVLGSAEVVDALLGCLSVRRLFAITSFLGSTHLVGHGVPLLVPLLVFPNVEALGNKVNAYVHAGNTN